MVMDGGGDSSMGMGCGSDGSLVEVLVPVGRGSWCIVFNGTVGFSSGLHRSTG